MFNNFFQKIESRPVLTFCLLLIFHALLAIILFVVANSEYLSNLHNGQGFWNFSKDSTLYHLEASNASIFLRNSQWLDWWSAYGGHQHVKLISLVYWTTGHETPISFEIINGLVWSSSIILLYKSSKLIFNNSIVSAISVLFFFQPSILMSSAQLLRDPFFILGICFMFYGWAILKKNKNNSGIIFILIGSVLFISMRQYLSVALFSVFFFYSIKLILNKEIPIPAISLLIVPLFIFMQLASQDNHLASFFQKVDIQNSSNKGENIPEPLLIQNSSNKGENIPEPLLIQNSSNKGENIPEPLLIQNSSNKGENIPEPLLIQNSSNKGENIPEPKSVIFWQPVTNTLNFLTYQLASMRDGFLIVNNSAGSKIDSDKPYNGFVDAISYFPRVVQVAFLSPFPSHWIETGKETGRIGRMLSGLEMLSWYFIILGFFYIVFTKPLVIEPLLPIIMLSVFIVILLGYVVPNIGAIYRMRQGYMIPFYMVGVYGIYSFIELINKKT
ncbi:MAG: hypothetical protein HOH49_04570 [Kordiimonadaceae bacterium]|nr:hypothetical protein [Kordiimonadaceae bacterium]